MGKINNYTVDPVNPGDKILASDVTTGDTKNVTAQSIADLQQSSVMYRAYMTQSGASAPVDTLIPGNTLNGIWSYIGDGEYIFTSSGAFDSVNVGCIIGVPDAYDTTFEFSVYSSDVLSFKSYSSGTLTNGLMSGLYVEIFTHNI